MNFKLLQLAGLPLVTALVALLAGCASQAPTAQGSPLTIERQGSFFVGGRQVTAAGTFDPTQSVAGGNAGQTFWIDQMYVNYQIPPNARKLPLVLVHGGGGSGQVWETTPDGREGFLNIFLRRGFQVYTVDAPRGGRSGIPTFTGDFGKLDEQQRIVSSHTARTGREQAWSRWRLGPRYPDTFAVQAFPMSGLDQFLRAIRPIVSDDPQVIASALVALLDKIGPAIVVTHSNSGVWGWLAGARSPNVKAIVSYEPTYVFPAGEMPPRIPLFKGMLESGSPVTDGEFANLARLPVQVVYGDNIPAQPVAELPADARRGQLIAARRFVDALASKGGKASLLLLPDAGLRGNSHFIFSDLNNLQVADQLSMFLARQGLDGR